MRRTDAHPAVITGRAISMEASSSAWARGQTGATLMVGAVTASVVVEEEATAVVVEEATAVSAETNPDVDLSGIMGMGRRSYAPATAMPWRVAASLMARHLMVARLMVGGPTVEGPTVATNTNSRHSRI